LGQIEYISRECRSEDINCAALVIAAAGSREINQSIYREAVQKGIPVNVVDDPELCTFFFPAVVCRNDLVIGITTSGSYPALSRYMREAVEELISEEYEVVTEHLREYREKVRAEIQDPIERRIVLRKLMETAVRTVEDSRQFCPRLLSERLNSTYEILRGIYIKPEHRSDEQ
jgi:precorrin-2 dehydrogenase/sirohydrochlorin ferrochelatase